MIRMLEIKIMERDWKNKEDKLHENIAKLKRLGWEKFGNTNIIVLFKDESLEAGNLELEDSNITNFKIDEFDEKEYIL
jgi:hypothetical protein